MITSWLGLELDGHKIESILGEGPFSTVYRAVPLAGGRPVAIKVAKEEIDESFIDATGFVASTATAPCSNGMGAILPEPSDLLRRQFDLLTAHSHARLIKPISLQALGDTVYMVLPYIAGPNLREILLANGAADAKEQLLILLEALEQLSQTKFRHGDIKPENILCTANGPILIDPGYFGTLSILGTSIKNCCISTARYYPFHDGDDLFALGIMTFEVLTGRHPLAASSGADSSERPCGPLLLEKIEQLEAVANHDYSGLANVDLTNSGFNAEQERILLKAVGLEPWQGKGIELTSGFATIEELTEQISANF